MTTTTNEMTLETATTETTATPVAPPKAPKVKKMKGKVKKAKVKTKGKVKKGQAKKGARKNILKPTTGQSGPEVEVKFEKLNVKELKVLAALNGEGVGTREQLTIEQLAKECFPSKSKAQSNSWVRNSLRRLFCGGWLEKMTRGLYKISESGRKKMARAEA